MSHMRLGDIANADHADTPKPLAGIRVLAIEQMAALPFGTQLLARLGAVLDPAATTIRSQTLDVLAELVAARRGLVSAMTLPRTFTMRTPST